MVGLMVALEEVGAVTRGFSEVLGKQFKEGGRGGEVSVAGEETDPSVGGDCVAKVGAADNKGLVIPVGRAVGCKGLRE